jgi:hypothetical protein
MRIAEPSTQIFRVCWTFDVAADSQEEANQKIEETMSKFTEMMGWEKPDSLSRMGP